jgi:hypothetical protein
MIINYTLSFAFTLVILTYLLRVPHILSGHPQLVNEYYIKNFSTSIPTDWILCLVYLWVANKVITYFNVKNMHNKVLMVTLTTLVISVLAMLYFKSQGNPSNFFTRWFKTVGFAGVVYDMFLLTTIYLVQQVLPISQN